jgi:NTE family protein
MQAEETIALVLSGGVGLGAYQAGAYAALHAEEKLRPHWLAASSIGAVNAAVIAGSPADERIERLRALWRYDEHHDEFEHTPRLLDRWRHLENWVSAIGTRLAGSPGHFRPRAPNPWRPFKSFYDLAPLTERIEELVDFDLLNSGGIRVTVAATDIETGELVLFDTEQGDRIGVDHLLASCGFLPEFAPVEIGGRLLGDGGLAANAPIEALRNRADGAMTCFVVDLFARDGARPADLETAVARKSDLVFANQTWQRLEAYCREQELRAQLANEKDLRTTIYYLSYRPEWSEAGSERPYDYSSRSIATRWSAGEGDMAAALHKLSKRKGTPLIELIPVRRQRHGSAPVDAAAARPRLKA